MTNDNQPIPSGYKPSPLGPIPEDWEVKSVKEISTIKGRIGYRGYTIDDIVNDGDGAISLSPSNIVDGKLQFNSVTSITWEKYYESPEIMLRDGDIVMVKTGSSFGKVAFVENLPHETTINPQFVIINNIKCDNKWLCYLFDSDCIQKNVHKIVVGGAIPTMSQEEIANFKIAVPPLPEQQRIVSVLSLWDTAIAKQTALIEQLTLRKRGLMQQLLTGKKRLKGFCGEWKEVRLGKMGVFFKGGGVPKDKITNTGNKCLTYGDLYTKYDFVISDVKSYIDDNTANESVKIQYGDICFAGSGETKEDIGKCAAFIDNEYGYAGGDIIVFRANDCNPITLSYILNSSDVIRQKSNMGQGHSVVHIYPYQLEKLLITLPSRAEQDAIATILIESDKEIEIQKQKLAAMQEQKKGLMQVLLTGKKRIK